MNSKMALGSISVGIAVFFLGFFLAFSWMEGSPSPRDYVVKAGARLELSWFLQSGDRTEGGFTVEGGGEEVRFSIVNPSGVVIHRADVKSRYDYGFTASDSGVYSFIFENLDNVNDESMYVSFRSPYEPRLTVYDGVGLLTMLGGIVLLFFGLRALRNTRASSEASTS